MGLTYARIGFAKDSDGPWRTVRLLVDTGAIHTILPRRILQDLGVRPQSWRTLRVADDRRIRRALGGAFLRYRGDITAAPILFGEEGDAVLLGVTSMEALGLEVAPSSGRLRRMRAPPLLAAPV
jgi:predicted aspartyl protease